MMKTIRIGSIYLMAVIFIGVGVNHFVHENNFEKIVPPFIPFASAAVYISGAFEMLFGAGLLFKITRRYAAIGLIVLLVAVFPANLYMYYSHAFPQYPQWILLLRLPMQILLILWAIWIATSAKSEQNFARR